MPKVPAAKKLKKAVLPSNDNSGMVKKKLTWSTGVLKKIAGHPRNYNVGILED